MISIPQTHRQEEGCCFCCIDAPLHIWDYPVPQFRVATVQIDMFQRNTAKGFAFPAGEEDVSVLGLDPGCLVTRRHGPSNTLVAVVVQVRVAAMPTYEPVGVRLDRVAGYLLTDGTHWPGTGTVV